MAEQIKFGDRLFLSGERVIVETDVQINRDLKVNRDVVIQGNLDVNGTVTTIDSTDLFIADPIVGMNYDHTGPANEDVGFEIHRGDDTNVFFVWDETLVSWSTRGTDLVVRNFHATGDTLINGTLHVDGQSTLASVNVEDLTDNRVVIVGVDGEIEDDANFTFDATELNIGLGNFTVQQSTGNTQILGTLNVDSQSTLASANIEDLTDNRIVITGALGELEDDANFTMDGTTFDIGQGKFTVDVATGDTYIAGQTTLASLNVEDLTNNRIVVVGVDGELEDDANLTFNATELNIGLGNFTVQQSTGNTQVIGTLNVDSQSTLASANVEDLTDNRIVIVGTLGELEDDVNFTFDATELNIGVGNFTVQQSTGNTQVVGTLNVDSQSTLASANVEDLTDNRIVIAGALGELEDDANFTMDGTTFDIGQGMFTIDVATGDNSISGQLTSASLNVEDLTDNRIVIAGTLGELEDDANFTFDATELNIGLGNFTVQQSTGNTQVIGTLNVDSQSTLASANVEDLTDNRIVIAGALGELEDDANFTFDATELNIGLGNFTVDVATGDTVTLGDLTVSQNAVVTGNLTVNGTVTTINTETILLADNILTLNSNYVGSTPTENAGIEIERGTLSKTAVRWNELSDIWEFTNDGTVYRPIPHTTDDLLEGSNNLYYTDVRVDARIVNAGSANWNTAFGWGDHASAGYWTQDNAKITNWDTAFGWGDHASAGYWTQDNAKITNWDTAFGWGDHASAGYWTQDNAKITNWDTAFGWGDHASAGYLTTFTEADTFATVTARGSTTTVAVGTGALSVTGAITATGDITAFYSDERLKSFEGKIDNALDKVSNLNGYYYTGNNVAAEFGYDTEHRQVGVSAQEVEAILPEVVKTAPISADGETDYKTVQYEKLVPLLIEAIKELKAEVEELKSKHL